MSAMSDDELERVARYVRAGQTEGLAERLLAEVRRLRLLVASLRRGKTIMVGHNALPSKLFVVIRGGANRTVLFATEIKADAIQYAHDANRAPRFPLPLCHVATYKVASVLKGK